MTETTMLAKDLHKLATPFDVRFAGGWRTIHKVEARVHDGVVALIGINDKLVAQFFPASELQVRTWKSTEPQLTYLLVTQAEGHYGFAASVINEAQYQQLVRDLIWEPTKEQPGLLTRWDGGQCALIVPITNGVALVDTGNGQADVTTLNQILGQSR